MTGRNEPIFKLSHLGNLSRLARAPRTPAPDEANAPRRTNPLGFVAKPRRLRRVHRAVERSGRAVLRGLDRIRVCAPERIQSSPDPAEGPARTRPNPRFSIKANPLVIRE